MGVASPFFRSLPINIPWIEPTAPCAHPLDDGTAVMLEHSIEATVDTLDERDESSYRSLIAPLASEFAELSEDILGPIQHIPRHPMVLARFGSSALLSAASLARTRFAGRRAQALLAGMATHSVLSLEAPTSAAIALTLIAAGHASGWPILRGGAQTLPDALARYLEDLGGHIEADHEVIELPQTGLILADITPPQLLRIAGSQLPLHYCKRLEPFPYAAGAFKIDYALRAPIPRTAPECSRAATLHILGSLEEIVESQRTFTSERPFVLLGQPSLFDPSRAPAGQHTACAYCHVPNGSTKDYTESIENQIARFAPEFRDCILARSVSSPAALEQWNPTLIGS